MELKKKIVSMVFVIGMTVLYSVNMTYAWQSFTQTALNVNMGEQADGSGGGSESDGPGNFKPGELPKPDDPKPENPKPSEKPEVPGTSVLPEDPGSNGQTSDASAAGADTDQIGAKGDIYTGDTGEVLVYMLIMLLSFILMTVGGSVLITLVMYRVDRNRRKR